MVFKKKSYTLNLNNLLKSTYPPNTSCNLVQRLIVYIIGGPLNVYNQMTLQSNPKPTLNPKPFWFDGVRP